MVEEGTTTTMVEEGTTGATPEKGVATLVDQLTTSSSDDGAVAPGALRQLGWQVPRDSAHFPATLSSNLCI